MKQIKYSRTKEGTGKTKVVPHTACHKPYCTITWKLVKQGGYLEQLQNTGGRPQHASKTRLQPFRREPVVMAPPGAAIGSRGPHWARRQCRCGPQRGGRQSRRFGMAFDCCRQQRVSGHPRGCVNGRQLALGPGSGHQLSACTGDELPPRTGAFCVVRVPAGGVENPTHLPLLSGDWPARAGPSTASPLASRCRLC